MRSRVRFPERTLLLYALLILYYVEPDDKIQEQYGSTVHRSFSMVATGAKCRSGAKIILYISAT